MIELFIYTKLQAPSEFWSYHFLIFGTYVSTDHLILINLIS